jgi:hypothetical protein
MCHQNDTTSVATLIEAGGDADYLRVTPKATGPGNKRRSTDMQAVATNRPNSFRALLIVVVLGAALVVAMLGGYAAGNRQDNQSVTSTSISQPSTGQSAPLHGRFGGFQ